MIPKAATTAGPLAARLEAPRRRLREAAPGALAVLATARAEIEAVRDGLDEAGRPAPAEALRRIALLTEVWECLAAEGSAAAVEVSAFCDRALADLGRADLEDEAVAVSARIVEETSSRWGEYLGLLDPDPAAPPDLGVPFPDDGPVEEDGPPGIDPADLLRMLLGTATPPEPSSPLSPSTGPAGELVLPPPPFLDRRPDTRLPGWDRPSPRPSPRGRGRHFFPLSPGRGPG